MTWCVQAGDPRKSVVYFDGLRIRTEEFLAHKINVQAKPLRQRERGFSFPLPLFTQMSYQ